MSEPNTNTENLDASACSATQWDTMKKEVLAAVDEKFDVEAVAQMVEQMNLSKQFESKIAHLAHDKNCRDGQNSHIISCLQNELRTLMMDVALLKRALVSMGQIGVIERKRIEKELILELFPPKQIQPGLGINIAQGQPCQPVSEDCDEHIELCKQACCRIFDVHLNADEAESGRYDWNPRSPYSLHKNHGGCVHLCEGKCTIYQNRPATCYTYSCKNDKRIWVDYDNKILNPVLRQRLIAANLLPKDENELPENATNADVKPPDFSKLREMTVSEPAQKFVPPQPKDAEECSS